MSQRVLVVDDNPKIVEVLSAYLVKEGFEELDILILGSEKGRDTAVRQ